MKAEQVKERIQKTQKAIEQKKNLIKKYELKLEKLHTKKYDDEYWRQCDISDTEEAIEHAKKALSEKEALLIKYEKQYEGAAKNDRILEKIPNIMKLMVSQLQEAWIQWDKEEREKLHKEYEELGYTEFCQKNGYAAYDRMHRTDEEIEKENKRTAEMYVLDLWNRIAEKVGNVLSWDKVQLVGPALNGYVTGEKGSVEIRTITAGGYNIQRLHCRTLVL